MGNGYLFGQERFELLSPGLRKAPDEFTRCTIGEFQYLNYG
jgi:hypothetical protein